MFYSQSSRALRGGAPAGDRSAGRRKGQVASRQLGGMGEGVSAKRPVLLAGPAEGGTFQAGGGGDGVRGHKLSEESLLGSSGLLHGAPTARTWTPGCTEPTWGKRAVGAHRLPSEVPPSVAYAWREGNQPANK